MISFPRKALEGDRHLPSPHQHILINRLLQALGLGWEQTPVFLGDQPGQLWSPWLCSRREPHFQPRAGSRAALHGKCLRKKDAVKPLKQFVSVCPAILKSSQSPASKWFRAQGSSFLFLALLQVGEEAGWISTSPPPPNLTNIIYICNALNRMSVNTKMTLLSGVPNYPEHRHTYFIALCFTVPHRCCFFFF